MQSCTYNEQKARSLLRMLHQHGNIAVKGSQKFQVNPLISIRLDENMELIIKDYAIIIKYEKETNTAEKYGKQIRQIREFQYIR